METVGLMAGAPARWIGLGHCAILHLLLTLEDVRLESLPSLRRVHRRLFARFHHEIVVVPEHDHVPVLLGLAAGIFPRRNRSRRQLCVRILGMAVRLPVVPILVHSSASSRFAPGTERMERP